MSCATTFFWGAEELYNSSWPFSPFFLNCIFIFFCSMIVPIKQLLVYFLLLIQVEHQLRKASSMRRVSLSSLNPVFLWKDQLSLQSKPIKKIISFWPGYEISFLSFLLAFFLTCFHACLLACLRLHSIPVGGGNAPQAGLPTERNT